MLLCIVKGYCIGCGCWCPHQTAGLVHVTFA